MIKQPEGSRFWKGEKKTVDLEVHKLLKSYLSTFNSIFMLDFVLKRFFLYYFFHSPAARASYIFYRVSDQEEWI